MAHAQAQATFDRHLPLWEAHGCPILVYCPANSQVQTRHPVLAYGKASHHDAEANRRFKFLLRHLERSLYDKFVVFEYDSFCLTPQLPLNDPAIAGNIFYDGEHLKNGFEGESFIHPPLMFEAFALQSLNEVLQEMPDTACRGFWDRLLGYATEKGSWWCRDFLADGIGFSRNTIETTDIPAVEKAVLAGATLIHGCKTEQCLKAILNAYLTRQNQQAK